VLRPHYAVFWAAFFNFVAFTVSGYMSRRPSAPGSSIHRSSIPGDLAALIGAIVWNLITWGLGIPSSARTR